MRIGFLLPSEYSLGNPGNGIAAQARFQAEALQQLGHQVVRLSPWQWQDANELDVVHSFASERAIADLNDSFGKRRCFVLAYSPIIDSNQSFLAYRLAALAGSMSSRIMTIPALLQNEAIKSDIVICRSVHERRRMVHGLGVSKLRTEIVLNGCPLPSDKAIDIQCLRHFDLPDSFILHVSAYTQERKNVLRLVEAAEDTKLPLVIAGRAMDGPVFDTLKRKSVNNPNLRILGFVEDNIKAALYAKCRVFCLPSIHEGTGLVAVEAASYGANIVITRNGGPADYFQDYVDYVDPFSVKNIGEGLLNAWNRPKNSDLRDHVLKKLSWENSASMLVKAYQSARENLATEN